MSCQLCLGTLSFFSVLTDDVKVPHFPKLLFQTHAKESIAAQVGVSMEKGVREENIPTCPSIQAAMHFGSAC